MSARCSSTHLYQQVYDAIACDIESGVYVSGDKLPSERQLSAQFGVDRITIRKAMDMLAERNVIDRIAGSGTYVKIPRNGSEAEGGEEKSGWHYIAFIMPDDSTFEARLSNAFHSEMLRVIERECNKNQCHLIFKTLNADTTLQQLAKSKDLVGMIFSSYVDEGHLQTVKQLGIPSVVVNYISREVTSVSIDNTFGAYEVTKYLLKLGHRDIAVIKGYDSYQSCKERMMGFSTAIKESGLDLSGQIMLNGNWQRESGYHCALELIDKHSANMPSAIFAMNDAMAFGAIEALTERGYNVPGDISVAGFDGIKGDFFHAPKLTTAQVNVSTIGKVAIQHLINSIHSENHLVKIIVPAALVIGNTTAPFKSPV